MMSSKRPLFGGRLHADPEDRSLPGLHDPANQATPEAGAQRRGAHPDAPEVEVDLLNDPPEGSRSRILSVFMTLAALVIFGGIAWYAYDWGMSQLETTRLPVILADSEPIKSRPESPGGLDVPNQDVAVLNERAPDPGQPQVERLLPPPETPLPPQTESADAEAMTEPEAPALAEPPLETAAGPAEKAPPEAESPPAAAPQIAVTPEPPPTAAEPPAPTAAEPPAPPTAAQPAPRDVTAPEPAAPKAEAPQVAAVPPATAPAGAYVVQLASLKSEDAVRPAWERLQKAHPALLGDRELAIQEADLGARGIFYRVRAGYFTDRAGALALCNALKARGQDCLVAKR